MPQACPVLQIIHGAAALISVQESFSIALALDYCAKLREVAEEKGTATWKDDVRQAYQHVAALQGSHYIEGCRVWDQYRTFLKDTQAEPGDPLMRACPLPATLEIGCSGVPQRLIGYCGTQLPSNVMSFV